MKPGEFREIVIALFVGLIIMIAPPVIAGWLYDDTGVFLATGFIWSIGLMILHFIFAGIYGWYDD